MHDGSIATLEEVVIHYNNGGVTNEGDPVNDFLSGGIRPLNLTDEQIAGVIVVGPGNMPGFSRLTPAQVDSLVIFTRSLVE